MVATERDRYVDWLRAVSLVVVVLWHWAFTILRWTPGGPQPTNPLGFFSGLWIFTWLLQVMPLFFYVGGYAHLVSWQRAQARGTSLARYIAGHIRPLPVGSRAAELRTRSAVGRARLRRAPGSAGPQEGTAICAAGWPGRFRVRTAYFFDEPGSSPRLRMPPAVVLRYQQTSGW